MGVIFNLRAGVKGAARGRGGKGEGVCGEEGGIRASGEREQGGGGIRESGVMEQEWEGGEGAGEGGINV